MPTPFGGRPGGPFDARPAWTADGPQRADEPETGDPVGAALSLRAEDRERRATGFETGRLTAWTAQGCAPSRRPGHLPLDRRCGRRGEPRASA